MTYGRIRVYWSYKFGKFSIPFLVLAIGFLINATNYVDGVDGLFVRIIVVISLLLIFS